MLLCLVVLVHNGEHESLFRVGNSASRRFYGLRPRDSPVKRSARFVFFAGRNSVWLSLFAAGERAVSCRVVESWQRKTPWLATGVGLVLQLAWICVLLAAA